MLLSLLDAVVEVHILISPGGIEFSTAESPSLQICVMRANSGYCHKLCKRNGYLIKVSRAAVVIIDP